MWACRSLLSRSCVPLLSQLHAFRRRANVVGGANCTVSVSRGHVSGASDGNRRDDALVQRDGGHHRTSPQQKQQQFLYLVLDDVKKGCSVHKLDMDQAAAAADEDDDGVVGRRLPGCPVFRMEYPTLGNGDQYVAVLGSNFIGIGTGSEETFDGNYGSGGVTEVLDIIKTAPWALTVLRGLPRGMHDRGVGLAVAAGSRLCLFPDDGYSMHYLELEEDEDIHGGGKDDSMMYPKSRWCWCEYSDTRLPFVMNGFPDHALHPGGRAFFVSFFYCSAYRDRDLDRWDRGPATFSYDTERGKWTHHGDWQLPFHGQAHYDRDMDAWIGLHFHIQHGRDDDLDTDGYLCCCDVPPLALRPPSPPPPWKLSKEKLFVLDIERHIEVKLVPMGGGGGNFCLVEVLTREGVDRKGCLGDGDKCVLRLTTFRVNYSFGGGGELTITDRRPVGEYKLSRYVDGFQVQAFWM